MSTTVLELNAQKEKNARDNKAVKEMEELLKGFQTNIEFADNEFTTDCLDEFDKLYHFQTKNHMNSNEVYKSIAALLKKVEKDYNFNAIDPIDEERDHSELKQRLKEMEIHREQMAPIVRDDGLTRSDLEKIDKIDDIKDLNEIK